MTDQPPLGSRQSSSEVRLLVRFEKHLLELAADHRSMQSPPLHQVLFGAAGEPCHGYRSRPFYLAGQS